LHFVTAIQAGQPEQAAVGRFRLASPATATVLGVLAVILMAVGIAMSFPVHRGREAGLAALAVGVAGLRAGRRRGVGGHLCPGDHRRGPS